MALFGSLLASEQGFGASAEPKLSLTGRLTREQVVDRIMKRNITASPGFLDQFRDRDLQDYLRRLDIASEPRGRRASWARCGESPAISVRGRR